MKIKTIQDLDPIELRGKRVLVRVDYNCPFAEGEVTDDTRIQATLPTLKLLLDLKAKPVLISHLGRPKGQRVPEMSLQQVAYRLKLLAHEKLNANVIFCSDCIGDEVEAGIQELNHLDRGILLLENLRFYKNETENDPKFAKELARAASFFIQDAFGTVHRAHASTEAITRELPSCAGLLVEKELRVLGRLLKNPPKPFVAIIGGAKISTKIEILDSLAKKVDTLMIGGGMAYTFLKAKDIPIGSSLCEKEFQAQAFTIISRAQDSNTKLILPVDHLAATEISENSKSKTVAQNGIPEGWLGADIGPKTISLFEQEIKNAGTVFWNGPIGIFEIDKFDKGSKAIAKAMAKTKAQTIVGGGDVISALNKFECAENITHISTGGGASMEFLSGKKLPGVLPLLDD